MAYTPVEQEVNLTQVIFSSWGRNVVDNRKGGEADLASLKLKLPEYYLSEGKVGAFMGWDGVVVMDPKTDIVAMAAEYMKRVQEKYCCAKCTPGKKGTKVLQDTLARIVQGHGEEAGPGDHRGPGAAHGELQVHPVHDLRHPGLRYRETFPGRLPGLHPRKTQTGLRRRLQGKAHRPLHGQVPGAHRHSRLHRGGQGLPLRPVPGRGAKEHADPGGLRPGLPPSLRDGLPARPGR